MFHTRISHYPRARRLVCSLLIFCFVFALSGCGSSSSDAPKPSPSPTPIETGDGGSYGMWVLEGLLKGLSSYVAGQSLGWLFSLLKGGGSTDSDAFKTMNQKMNDIIGDLKTIQATLDRVLGLINLKADQIIEQDAYYNMKGNIDTISTDYGNYLWMLSNAPTKENAASQAKAYIDADNMEFQIEEIYTGIMGTTPGIDAGALYESTTLILDQQTGIDATQLLNSYLSLETIFIQLVEYQLQGAALEVEGLHWRDNPWVGTLNQKDSDGVGSAVGSEFPGTAEEFMTSWFQPKLDDEVEEFLRCVDRIVCSQLDLRTDITTTSQTVDGFLPSTAEQIYFRADFIAAQFSSRHQFGVNVRLVGEPTTIEAIAWGGSANVQFQDGFGFTANMTLVPLGLTTSPGYPVRYNPVEKWWNWPTGYDESYAEWNWATYNQSDNPNIPAAVSGHIKFGYTTQVVVAKFNISDIPTQGVVVKTTYPHEAASFNSAGNYVPWYYDDAMNPEPLPPATPSATSENLYGHVTLAIRHRPDVWYQYRDLVETSDSSEFSTTCDSDTSDVIWARGVGALQRNYDGVDEWFHIESGVAVPIMSDVGWNKKVGVSGNLQGDCSSSFWNQTVIDQDTARLWGYWTQGDSTEYDWWGLEQATGHSYGGTTAYHYFAPGETCPYHILIYEYLAPSGEKGSEFSAKVWPQVMYLWF